MKPTSLSEMMRRLWNRGCETTLMQPVSSHTRLCARFAQLWVSRRKQMGWPEKLVLVRHAESEGNVLSIEERPKFECSAHGYGLTDRGKKQAEITGKYLREQFGAFDAYYVSYYQRARDTLKIMYPGVKVFEDSRLAEAQRGIYHTMTHDEIEAKFPEELKRKEREGLYHYRPWGGENWADVELRIHSFLGTLSRDFEGQKVLVVVHGHWLVMLQK